jgi:hypothetical protein
MATSPSSSSRSASLTGKWRSTNSLITGSGNSHGNFVIVPFSFATLVPVSSFAA